MNAAWMLSSATVALLFAATAFVVARVAALYRGVPLRGIWALAMLASLAFALVWLRPAAPLAASLQPTARAPIVADGQPERSTAPNGFSLSGAVMPPSSGASVPLRSFSVRLPTLPESVGGVMRYAWIAMSSALLLLLGWAGLRLRRERISWECRELDDTLVFISDRFGPAIVGVSRPAIVLPRWVLDLEHAEQHAIVAHEAEHRAAHDPVLLLAGLLAVVVMPWSPGLWLSWRGLRRAIELDCDERVVRRGIEGGEYARVLLHAWKTARGSWLASTAFAERATGLGARVEHLMRPEPRGRAMRTVLGAVVAAGFVFIACSTPAPQATPNQMATSGPYPLVVVDGVPRPDLPPLLRFTGPVTVDTMTTPTYHIAYHGPQQMDTAARKLYPSPDDLAMMQTIDAPASVAHFGDVARYGAVLYYTRKYRAGGGAIIAPGEGNSSSRRADPPPSALDMKNGILANLFSGITLSPDKASQARTIIETEMASQGALRGPVQAIFPQRIALNAARDAQLRALLSSDADRAKFDQRSREGRPCCTPSIEDEVKSQYSNFFGYPDEPARMAAHRVPLAADKQEQARTIIRNLINDELALYTRAPAAWVSTRDERLAMRMKRDASIRALLATEADREKFDTVAARLREMVFNRS